MTQNEITSLSLYVYLVRFPLPVLHEHGELVKVFDIRITRRRQLYADDSRQAAAAGTSKTSARYFINFAFVLLLLHSTETFVRLHWEYYAELRTHKSLYGSQEAAVVLLRLVQPHAAGGQRVPNVSHQL